MDFKSAQTYLESFISYEKKNDLKYDEENFNLERFRKFADEIGVDYSKLKFVHVAGSKGKGSVCNFVAEYMRLSGFKVGLFTSPHFIEVRERIKILGEMIPKKDFVFYIEWIKNFLESGKYKITYFEVLTIIAFKFFVDKKVDYAVLEVGLGGRLDATNIVIPELSILTRVEMEHVGILGNTLEDIISEKLGIVKKGVSLLVGSQSSLAIGIIKKRLERKFDVFYVNDFENEVIEFFRDFNLSNFDEARVENLRTVYVALKLLFLGVDKEAFRVMAEEFEIRGRVDVRQVRRKTVVFDVAHTVSSIENLLNYLKAHFPGKKFVFLVSFLRDKNVAEIGRLISNVAHKVVLTSSSNPRAFSVDELKRFFIDAGVSINIQKAFNDTVNDLKEDQILVVVGSHYLIGGLI